MPSENDRYVQLTSHQPADSGPGITDPEYPSRARSGEKPLAASGLITILFTDLVGSTELASEVGDAAADELRREHFASLREAVAATGGNEVKTIGDALMVAYPGAADARAGGVASLNRERS